MADEEKKKPDLSERRSDEKKELVQGLLSAGIIVLAIGKCLLLVEKALKGEKKN